MYVSGGISNRCAGLQQHNVMVQIGKDVSFENPVVSYAGVGEIDRAFRGRSFLHPQNDFKTVLECINVEASEDSICGGGDAIDQQQHRHPQHSLVGIPSTINASAPPKVKVTYKLSQQYGTFSVNSLLVVTIQVRRGCPSTKIRKITPKKVGVPLATSGFTPRAASAVAVAATAHSGPASVALVKAASEIVAATKRLHSNAGHSPNGAAVPLVAEVVRIEEQWNGVQLLHFAPFHWSRRLNGLVAGSAAYFFFN